LSIDGTTGSLSLPNSAGIITAFGTENYFGVSGG